MRTKKWHLFIQQALERAGVHRANENKDVKKTSPPSSVEGALEAADAGQQIPEPVALTVRQLLVRRGLSLLLMFSILAAAIYIAELLAA